MQLKGSIKLINETEVISEKIHKIEGINSTETSLILKYIKRRYDWKTAIDK